MKITESRIRRIIREEVLREQNKEEYSVSQSNTHVNIVDNEYGDTTSLDISEVTGADGKTRIVHLGKVSEADYILQAFQQNKNMTQAEFIKGMVDQTLWNALNNPFCDGPPEELTPFLEMGLDRWKISTGRETFDDGCNWLGHWYSEPTYLRNGDNVLAKWEGEWYPATIVQCTYNNEHCTQPTYLHVMKAIGEIPLGEFDRRYDPEDVRKYYHVKVEWDSGEGVNDILVTDVKLADAPRNFCWVGGLSSLPTNCSIDSDDWKPVRFPGWRVLAVKIGNNALFIPGISAGKDSDGRDIPIILYDDLQLDSSGTHSNLPSGATDMLSWDGESAWVTIDKSKISDFPFGDGNIGKEATENWKKRREPQPKVVEVEDEEMEWPGYNSPLRTQYCKRFPEDKRCHPDSIANVKGRLDFEDDEDIDIELKDDYESPFSTDFCERFPDHPMCRD